MGSVRIALATDDGETIGEGHFAHARRFFIYDYDQETGDIKMIEDRRNPLGDLPDMDDPAALHRALAQLNIPMHGVAKYQWLREKVLSDVDVVIAGGACQTSYNYFTSSGVQLLFVDPGTPVSAVIEYLRNAPNEEEPGEN
jgi:predicted Fe-Mo cluster-binding NifX family protein